MTQQSKWLAISWVWVVCSAVPTQVALGDQGLAANDARELGAQAEPPTAEIIGPPNPSRAAPISAAAEAAGLTAAISAAESKTLGPPKSLLNSHAGDGTPPRSGLLRKLDPGENELTRVLGALAIVITLLGLTRWVMRKAGVAFGGMGRSGGGARPSGVVEVLARYPIARGQHLVLLKMARRIVLLHQGPASMAPLSEISDADEVANLLARMEAGSGERSAGKFRAALREFMSEHETVEAAPARAPRARRELPPGEAEIIDLTKTNGGWLGALLGRGTAR